MAGNTINSYEAFVKEKFGTDSTVAKPDLAIFLLFAQRLDKAVLENNTLISRLTPNSPYSLHFEAFVNLQKNQEAAALLKDPNSSPSKRLVDYLSKQGEKNSAGWKEGVSQGVEAYHYNLSTALHKICQNIPSEKVTSAIFSAKKEEAIASSQKNTTKSIS